MKIEKDINAYADIIGLARPVSKKHPPMPLENRAAQFSPFAALTGYEDLIDETARPVDRKIELDDGEKAEINRRLNDIQSKVKEEPCVTLSYYIPDLNKAGGRYELTTGTVKKVDPADGVLVLASGERIPFDDILTLETR